MDKTLKRQIGYQPEKKSVAKSNGTPPKKEAVKIVKKKPQIKRGRKFKNPEDIVIPKPVWLKPKDIEIIEKKYGSLTEAIKETALVQAKAELQASK